MSRRRWLLGGGGALVGLALLCGVGLWAASAPLPSAVPGPEAEALAERMVASVDGAAWARTGAIAWTFGGRNTHLWDRERHLDRVRWGDTEVLLDLTRRDGRAMVGGQPVHGPEAERLFADAYARWVNDSFWLNPVVKVFDEGTQRARVDLGGGRQGLLVRYTSGGVTPGDSYLWLLDDQHRPVAWRLWVAVIPIGGLETSWEDWQQLPTGAWVAPRHTGPLGLTLELTDIRAASSLAQLSPEDPFAPLFSPEE